MVGTSILGVLLETFWGMGLKEALEASHLPRILVSKDLAMAALTIQDSSQISLGDNSPYLYHGKI